MPQDISDQTFEQSVAEAAVARLKSKAPALVDYLLGFQLVDRSDDDTRAVGFFGFKIGKAWVYVPVFFVSGEVKGLELMYAKDSDLFLPLEEGWVNYLIQKRPYELGKSVDRDRKGQGITGPDLRRLRVPPTEAKIASTWAEGRCDGHRMFSALQNDAGPQWSLPEAAARRGKLAGVVRAMRDTPELAECVLHHYSLDDFRKAAARRKTVDLPAASDAPERKKVVVLDGDDAADPTRLSFLSDAEKERVMAGGSVVVDGRQDQEKKKVYRLVESERLENPTGGGLYDVLTTTGSLQKALALIPQAVGSGTTRDIRLVVQPGGKFYVGYTTAIYCTKQYSPEEQRAYLQDLGTPVADCDWQLHHSPGYVIVGSGGTTAIGPFVVDSVLTNEDGTTTLVVKDNYCGVSGRIGGVDDAIKGKEKAIPSLPFDGVLTTDDGIVNLDNAGQSHTDELQRWPRWDATHRIILTDKPLQRIVRSRGVSMVPKTFRVVKLTEPVDVESAPGTTADMYLGIGKFAAELVVSHSPAGWTVRSDAVQRAGLTEKAALLTLLQDVGVGEDSARSALKLAADLSGMPQRLWVDRQTEKQAAPPFDSPDFDSHWDSTYGVPVQQGGLSLQNLLPEHASWDPGKDQEYRHYPGENEAFQLYGRDLQTLQQASATGQKDVFDAAALKSLIDTDSPGDEIDEFLPDIVRAVDKLGRTLFMFYWHAEDLQDRFGKQELQDLEENVKAVFQKLGDTALDLQKKMPGTDDFLSIGSSSAGGQ